MERPNVGECQEIYNKYNVDSTNHTGTTTDLCEVIKELENRLEQTDEQRLLDALLCCEYIAMHQEDLPKNLKTEKEKELHSALNKIYRISHVAKKPSCFDAHDDWESEFQNFIPVTKI